MDFTYCPLQNLWVHHQSGVTILDEDMPDELLPDGAL